MSASNLMAASRATTRSFPSEHQRIYSVP
ncbi:hypothetical protein VDGL01_03642 [Verticillium dahliae]